MSALRQIETVSHIDRRGALRHPVTIQGVISSAHGEPQDVTLLDISERGCRIGRLAELHPDSVICLSFGGFTPIQTTVAWTTSDAAGLRFDQPVHPALIEQVVAAAKGRRRAPSRLALVRRDDRERLWHLRRPVSLRIGDGAFAGVLCDLSMAGCRVASAETPPVGAQLRVTLAGRRPLTGEVRWCDGGAIGVHFTQPLPAEIVRSIAQDG